MKRTMSFVIVFLLITATTVAIKPSSAVDTLSPNDFKLQSFSKTVDFFDFARSYATSHNETPPPANWHAYLYQTYVNVSGFQLYYSGLSNITMEQGVWLTIPVQSLLEHFKTPAGKDVLTSSSFIMLLAFNDTDSSRYRDSPDVNDNLYASFSWGVEGVNLTRMYGRFAKPALTSKTEICPLKHSADNLTWEWGMRYTNLTAFWWRTFTNPDDPRFRTPVLIAITTYDELTFTYKLTLNPTNNTAKLTANYVIGKMTNLWLVYLFLVIPIVYAHLNRTGTYLINGTNTPQTIHQFLERQQIKMSIVLFQNSLVLNHETKNIFSNQTTTDVDVGNDAEVEVSNGEISTEAANEKIFNTDFGTKKQYRLYNCTEDYTEKTYSTYEAVTRTVPRSGYIKNPLFSIHVALLKYVPLIVAHIDPPLYQKAKDHMLNMTYADYFYIISYPKYSGFKVKHDPTYTAYIATTSPTTELPKLFGPILIAGISVAAVIGTVLILKRRSLKTRSVPPPAPFITTT